MKLYYSPGACSIGIHVLLEEVGKPYEAVRLNFQEGEQYKPGFTGVNPKSKVPTLVRDDGSVLTEYPAIALWLAGKDYVAGAYSFADSAVFYVSFWWNGRLKKELPGNVAAHYARMRARPAVQRTLQQEGLAA